MSLRDNFQQTVVRTVALRAGHLCSHCRHPTCGPHSDPEKHLITGIAAHICAAAEGGPRYNNNQSPEERRSIANAIWLCCNCSKKVDTDWKLWTATRLIEMKELHEHWITNEGMIPKLPDIRLDTQTHLRMCETVPVITPEIQSILRDQELVIWNTNNVELFDFALDWTLPEVVATYGDSQVPIGSNVSIRPIQPPNTAIVHGNASVEMGRPVLTNHMTLQIDRLPAKSVFRFGFYTKKPEMSMPYEICKSSPNCFKDPELMDEHHGCHFFLEGKYNFKLRGEFVAATVFVPLFFKANTRTITARLAQDSTHPWRVWHSVLAAGATLRVGGNQPAVEVK